MTKEQAMYIAVEGCIGAGKTTIAEGLAAYRHCKAILEDFEANPFLRSFYENPAEYALETEFSFLLQHYHQLKAIGGALKHRCVTDFTLAKDLLFAQLNLVDPIEKRAFHDLYQLLASRVLSPSIIVCLSASDDLIVQRVRQRSRTLELKADLRYYADINAAYNTFFKDYRGAKVMLEVHEWDFLHQPQLYGRLSSLIDEQLACL